MTAEKSLLPSCCGFIYEACILSATTSSDWPKNFKPEDVPHLAKNHRVQQWWTWTLLLFAQVHQYTEDLELCNTRHQEIYALAKKDLIEQLEDLYEVESTSTTTEETNSSHSSCCKQGLLDRRDMGDSISISEFIGCTKCNSQKEFIYFLKNIHTL